MDTDSTAEIRIAHRKQLIEKSEKLIADTKNLVEQSHRLIRIAMGHNGEGNDQKSDDSGSVGTATFTSFSTSHIHRSPSPVQRRPESQFSNRVKSNSNRAATS